MSRPPIPRTVRCWPGAVYYKPRGIPLRFLEEVVLGLDEIEAMRLADGEGLSHQEVAERMNVSRATVGRILELARSKVADALTSGKAIRIEGGPARGPAGAALPWPPPCPGPMRGRGRFGHGGPPWARR